jgi:hypothetical protein
MQATRSDVFALKKSGLDAFLYADVGPESNGSTLTILSVLARLGKDPWAESARWATLPKAAVIDSLTQSIAQMPFAPSALAGARDSAARLVQLLPMNPQGLRHASAAQPGTAMPNRVLITILYFAFAVGMALNVLLIPKPSSHVPAPIERSTATPEATHPATGSLPERAAVAGSLAVPGRH